MNWTNFKNRMIMYHVRFRNKNWSISIGFAHSNKISLISYFCFIRWIFHAKSSQWFLRLSDQIYGLVDMFIKGPLQLRQKIYKNAIRKSDQFFIKQSLQFSSSCSSSCARVLCSNGTADFIASWAPVIWKALQHLCHKFVHCRESGLHINCQREKCEENSPKLGKMHSEYRLMEHTVWLTESRKESFTLFPKAFCPLHQ